MCGIFGLIVKETSPLTNDFNDLVESLFLLSESRGKEASGYAFLSGNTIEVVKSPLKASELVKQRVFRNGLTKNKTKAVSSQNSFSVIGHSRLVTDGYEQDNQNNQPVVTNDFVMVHNGIVVNHNELWLNYPQIRRQSNLDTEIIPAILLKFLNQGKSISESFGLMYDEINGMTTLATIFTEYDYLFLSTNNGSLYFSTDHQQFFVFGSELTILKDFIKKNKINAYNGETEIVQLLPNHYLQLDLSQLSFVHSSYDAQSGSILNHKIQKKVVIDLSSQVVSKNIYINTSLDHDSLEVPQRYLDDFNKRYQKAEKLIRCTKCILPETFPLISFDDDGICNYCRDYTKLVFKGEDQLKLLLESVKTNNTKHDCLIPFSGGRDSSYLLHIIKTKYNMNPLAFSYDWGMLTDLARRNQSRMCGKLGVEHILISADIRHKRENIRKNVEAWLAKPNLGTIPLFMAGDKQYFYYANKLAKENEIPIIMMGENPLEKTGFKTGFSGAKQSKDGFMAYSLDLPNKIRMSSFYIKEFIKNPKFINSSLYDTTSAFFSYYVLRHDYLNYFDFIPWSEEVVNQTLLDEYKWEIDPETTTTWRIGDGTAAFYNYIYFMVVGFTENDTFRSNQIREGILSRSEALNKIYRENYPRWNSIKWYLGTIKVDFNKAVSIINQIPAHFDNVS
jgi:glucosamine--fructose-6-phosphate aminotransferase (isomerizing)